MVVSISDIVLFKNNVTGVIWLIVGVLELIAAFIMHAKISCANANVGWWDIGVEFGINIVINLRRAEK